MPDSTAPRARQKPDLSTPEARQALKPRPDFPLFAHRTKRWAKKVHGKLVYLGPVTAEPGHGAQAALERWLDGQDYYLSGRTPPTDATDRNALTVAELCNQFLNHRKGKVEVGKLNPRTWQDYHQLCKRLVEHFGRSRAVATLEPADFSSLLRKLAETLKSPASQQVAIRRVRCVFNYAADYDLVPHAIKLPKDFAVGGRELQKARAQAKRTHGPRLFSPADIHAILEAANVHTRAMILIALNCGYGNTDIALLRDSDLDLDGGWATLPRSKTGAERACPLWAETIAAIRVSRARRPEPISEVTWHLPTGPIADLTFLTRQGKPIVRLDSRDGDLARAISRDTISDTFRRLLEGLNLYRHGLSFYTLRHTFETVGGESVDQVAVDHIMGHSRGDMASVYRERISDERLQAVTDHVRQWLFDVDETKPEE